MGTPSGLVLFRGPSQLDGRPVVAIATGLLRPSSNRATGPVVQVWFIRDRVHPVSAVRSGGDASVCGDCIHRGTSCYVQVWREVAQIWLSYRSGTYPVAGTDDWRLLRGRVIRWGGYGDPACVPVSVTGRAHDLAGGWLSYSHAWHRPEFQDLRSYCMASVDSPAQREEALSLGWRTFRIRAHGEPLEPGEFVCPKGAEASRRLVCLQCLACGGGEFDGKATPAAILHGVLPHRQRSFAADTRRFVRSLAVVS